MSIKISDFKSLVEIFMKRKFSDSKGITFIYSKQQEIFISYRDLYIKSLRVLYNLQQKGLKSGDELVLLLEDNQDYICTYWACLLGGIIPVITTVGKTDEDILMLHKVLQMLKNPRMIVSREANDSWRMLNEDFYKTLVLDDLSDDFFGTIYAPELDDIAELMFSSGSTGEPKGVIRSHKNLLTNLADVIDGAMIISEDVFLGWTPLTHAFGLTGWHMIPLLRNCNQYIMSKEVFVNDPMLWFEKAAEQKATLLGSPNFGYKHFLSFFDSERAKGWDLSHIRLLFNAAEPISVELCNEFLATMSKYNLKQNTMYPFYGMTETCMMISLSYPGKDFQSVCVDRRSLNIGEVVRNVTLEDEHSTVFADVGYPGRNCSIRICDDTENILGENIIGHIQVYGNHVTSGYYCNEEATNKVFTSDGWLKTGDIGFLRDGRLIIVGRAKDIIFVNGANFFPHDIERIIREVEGLSDSQLVVCGITDETIRGEKIVGFIVSNLSLQEFTQLSLNIKKQVRRKMGLEIAEIIPVCEIPKTSSGKIQRYKLGQLYTKGEFDTELAEIHHYIIEEAVQRQVTLPSNEIEEKLVKICQGVLLEDRISINDKLYEISGDSLKIIQLVTLINQEFNTNLKITDLFRINTIKEIAEFLAVEDVNENRNDTSMTEDYHKNNFANVDHDRDIAVIGMAGRFPEADTLEEFWVNLLSAKNSIRKYPVSRREELQNILGEYASAEYVEQGYLNNLTLFEPELFSINKEESKYIDPQQRLLLELVEEAILDAGYNPEDLSGKEIGVFLSSNQNEYAQYIDSSSMFAFVNRVSASNAARIAYVYNFFGQVMSIDTACSSSLVAIHNACQNIRWGEVEYAVAGGVHLRLVPPTLQDIEQNPTLSIDQKLKAFAKDANGTVDGEGGGILLLKSLKKALRDGDPIHAVIKGSAVNSNGNRSNGLNAPNEKGQSDVILKAITNAQIDPLTISYIETHGTGTKIGDPIEIAGLTDAFAKLGYAKKSVPVGSLKTNIGHLIRASGVANVIKTILSLKNQMIPASLNYSAPNPFIDFENSAVYVNAHPVEWKSNTMRRAGVTSLGLTGTNAHLILEEAPQIRSESMKDYSHIITLSARTPKSLREMIHNLEKYIELHPKLSINEIAYTLNTGRRDYSNKCAIVADSTSDLLQHLKNKDYSIYEEKFLKEITSSVILPDVEEIDWANLQNLYQTELSFKVYVDGLFAEVENKNDLSDRNIQYLLYCYAFIKLLQVYSLNPMVVRGVGLGKIVATCIQRKLTLSAGISQILEYGEINKQNNEDELSNLLERTSQIENNLVVVFSPRADLAEIWSLSLQSKEQAALLWMIGDTHSFYKYLIKLMQNGLKINWSALYQEHGLQKINLPGYVFDRESYFVKSQLTENIVMQSTQPEHVAAQNTVEIIDSVEKKVYEMMKELISSEKFDVDEKFFDTGITSVAIIHFIGKIKKEFGVELHVTQFFDDITLKDLISRITDVINDDIQGSDYIKKQPDQDYYSASAAQKRVFVLNQFGNDLSYNVPIVLKGEGSFKPEKLEAAFKTLIKRHEALRTSFDLLDGQVVQRIHSDVDFDIIHFELQGIEKDQSQYLEQLITQFIQPFDIGKAPLFRVGLIEAVDQCYLLLDFHHIISDGVSVNTLLKELADLYLDKELPELRLQYRDFAVWQMDFLQSEDVKKQAEYWLARFAGEIPVLELPTDYPRPATRSVEGDTLIFSMSKDMTLRLNQFVAAQGVTLYMALLAAFNVAMAKYTGQTDLIIGSPITGRRHADLEGIIGMFVNTLAMRNNLKLDQRFTEFLKEVKVNALNAYENQDYQFEELVERLALDRDLSRNPLFDVMFVLQNANNFDIQLGDAKFALYQFESKVTKFDLTLSAFEIDGEIKFSLEYCTKLFKKSTIQRFAEHYINIINAVIDNPACTITHIEMMSTVEKEQIINQFNHTKRAYPVDQTITRIFEKQVERTPANLAVVYENQQLSYCQLNEKANQLAWYLRSEGVSVDQVIGIMVEPSLEMLIGIMGILKAGGAYLPIDPQYPTDRIEYILADSNVHIVLTQEHLIHKIKFTGKIIDITDKILHIQEKSNLPEVNTASNLAYVIYTSGSTGQPKGVMIEHKSLVNLVCWHNEYFGVTEIDHAAKYAGFSFDASVWEIFPYLSAGSTIYIINPEIRLNVGQLNAFFEAHQISISFLPTQICEQFLEIDNSSLRLLLTGGDKLQFTKNQTYQLINNYGPTENTVVTTSFTVDSVYANIPIGKPIANTQVYILDQDNQIQPIGVPGELCISGIGLARGYVNNSKLTDEKFVENPFVLGSKMYRTGDRARWLSDGTIEFCGRTDHQVKIRGFRIELGEIENQLLNHPDIEEAVVLDRINANGNKYLCAYLVIKSKMSEMQITKGEVDSELPISEIRSYLSQSLPDYMIPTYYIFLNQLPLTANGKIDRKALRELDVKNNSKEYVAPRTKTEEKLVEIWKELLGVEKVGIHDNFFEMGGHSLNATQLMVKVLKEFNAELPFIEIFKNKTIEEMAAYLGRTTSIVDFAIPAINASIGENSVYPASSAQKRLFVISDLEGENITYNMPYVLMVEGELVQERFAFALKTLIARHESLRTSFERRDGEIVQIVHNDVNFDIAYLESSEGEVQKIIEGFIKPFDLHQAPLVRAGLVKCGEQYLFLLDMHHIISDGISMDIFFKEFFKLYEGQSLPELRIQYKDFATWQREFLQSEGVQKQENYWLNVFTEEIPVLNLPTDYASIGTSQRPTEMTYAGRWIEFALSGELSAQVKSLATDNDVTLYMILLAAFNVLLAKYSDQEDIIIGSAVAGRHHPDVENIIGMFVNTLALRNYPVSQKTFTEFLADVKANTLDAFANQDYQFEMLVDKLGISRDLSRNPLFDVMFVLQNSEDLAQQIPELGFRPLSYEHKVSKFDLTLYAFDEGERVRFILEYSTTLFKSERMENLTRHFVNIINAVVNSPQLILARIELLSSKEMEILLEEFNNTRVAYPEEKTIGQLFEEQVRKNADQIAVTFEEQKLSYRELNERANQLARVLIEKGAGPDKIIGIKVERSIEMVVGVLSIVKAGGAYLPIDVDYPQSRVQYMLKDSGANILLVVDEMMVQFAGEVINIADPQYYSGNSLNLTNYNRPNDLIYIIYTSGSTGEPKGVMIEHKNVNRLISNSNMLKIDAGDRILQTGSLAFDASTFEIWGALLNGASLYLISKDELLSTEIFEYKMKNYQITMIWLTAALFNQFFEERPTIFANLRTLFVGGDVLSPKHINLVRKMFPELTVVNGYGPTESTTFATYLKIDQTYENSIPIGKPVSNTQVYILNKDDQVQPVGVPGEICISGDGLARGYLNRVELTREKFVTNPVVFAERMYRTGDQGRWTRDGNIEFIGRMDNQVKIRGFRIELGEIEGQLLQHKLIKEAIVLTKTAANGEKYLSAYLVSSGAITSAELRGFLAKRIPEYMIPSYINFVDQMPLTTNGKIDRHALMQMDNSLNVGVEYIAPETDDEKKMAKIWSEILGVNSIGINDNFFEIGGHSLKATQLISRVWKEFNAELSLRTIFKTKTIKGLLKEISKTKKVIFAPIELVAEQSFYPVSSAQKRLYAIHALDSQNIAYNMPYIMVMEGTLDLERVENAFKALIKRHESLRTAFVIIDGQVMQQIHEEVDFSVWKMKVSEEVQINEMVSEFIKPFDLAKAPLLRIGLIEIGENKHIFMLDMHHIISDGISMGILFNEFCSLYNGEILPEARIQYKDFAVWQNQLFMSDEMKQQEEYWLNTFAGAIPVLQLPIDEPRPAEKTFEGNYIKFAFTQEMSVKIKEFAAQRGTTLYMTLLAVFNLLLARYSGQEDIVVGSPVAGRRHADLENIIGMFVNTLAMRNYPVATKTFAEFLQEVKDNSLKAFENQDYQFEMLVEKLDLARDLSRSALFDVMFVLQNAAELTLQLHDLSIKPYQYEYNLSKFDLTLGVYEESQRICFNLEYCTRLFKDETIKRLGMHYINILSQIIENPDVHLAEIEMLTQAEKEQILREFNNTTIDFPMEKTISQLFEEQVQQTPDQIAVVFDGQCLTYAELNEKSNQLARVLREKGVIPDQIVGIMVERSLEMVVGMMGILKAGGAYLPIDPDYPVERVEYMLADSEAVILLTQTEFLDKVESQIEIMNLEEDTLYSGESSNLDCTATPNHLAYIIYTSGSTGIPKGVMIEQKGVVSLLTWFNVQYDLKKNKNVLQMTNYIFDPAVEQILGSLVHGASVYLLPKNTLADKECFSSFIRENEINIVNFVPSALRELIGDEEKIPCVQVLISGGERLEESVKAKLIAKGYDLYNHYGPTETTVDALAGKCSLETKISLGRPIANVQCYIIDQQGKLAPIGVPGEICLAGVGLARGYLNNRELTNDKFVVNPFKVLAQSEKMYRTGDLGRWLSDGTIEFIGRIDDQVKIRGYRIELGEIEKQIRSHSAIKDVVVSARTDESGSKYLCAYLVTDDKVHVPVQQLVKDLRAFLLTRLPDYMIPAYFVNLSKIPVTATGKIDRNALLEVAVTIETDTEYIAPTNALEKKLVQIWGEVLGVQHVGITDNFFLLGGDSIKAIQIIARAKQHGIHLAVRDIFKHKTIANLVKEVDYAKVNEVISQDEVTGNVLLTPIQKWFFTRNFAEKHYYHQSNLFALNSSVDLKLLKEVLLKLIQHHDALRMGFTLEHGAIKQFNRASADVEFNLPLVDLASYEYEVQKEMLKKYSEEMQNSFNLVNDLLIKAVVFDLGQEGQRLLIVIHHLIIDGVSWRILLEDLENLYRSKLATVLPAKTTSFKDWSQRLTEYVQTKKIDIAYWQKIDPAQIQSLTQKEVKDNYLKDHQRLFVEFDRQQTEKLLTGVNWAYITEINDILLAALLMAVTEAFNTNSLFLNLEGHGREEIFAGVDLTRTIGWFTSTYPVYLEKQEGIEETIIYVKDSLKLIPEKGLNFDLARYLQNNDELQNLNPEISFNYLGQFDGSFSQHGENLTNCLRTCHEEIASSLSLYNQYDYLIDINGMIINGKFQLSFSFNAQYFSKDQLLFLQQLYATRLNQIIEHCLSKSTRTYTTSDFGLEKVITAKDFEYLAETYDLHDVKIYALTPMQEGMLFHSLLNEESNNYYEQLCLSFEGHVDIEKLQIAWQEMMNRHEILRTCYIAKPLEKPVQLILSKSLAEIHYHDFSELNVTEERDRLEQFTAHELKQRFDFTNGRVSRLALVKLAPEKYYFCWTFHHILLDGWSMQIVLNDFFQIYQSLITNRSLTLKMAPQFGTYLEWLKDQELEKGMQFWADYLKRLEEPTLMVLDSKEEQGESIAQSITCETVFDEVQTTQITEFCKRNNITLNAFVQTALGILLQKYHNTDQSCFGSTVSGRPVSLSGVEEIVGLFINTLPVVMQTDDNTTVMEILAQVNNELVEIREYEHVPLVEIQKLANHIGKLFDSIIVFENYPVNTVLDEMNLGFTVHVEEAHELTNYDFVLAVGLREKLIVKLSFNADRFTIEETERIQTHLLQIITKMLENEEQLIKDLNMLTEKEKAQLVNEFNNTSKEYLGKQTIIELFEEQVQISPDQLAFIFNEQQLTYHQLNERANQLARRLRVSGVQSDQIIGIMVERSLEMIIGLLGIWKADGAYLPLDPEYPEKRISYLLADSQISLLLCTHATEERLKNPQFTGETIILDDEKLYVGDSANLDRLAINDQLAYVIYTSGTTGTPKGVMIEHQAIGNTINWRKHEYHFGVTDVALQLVSYTFDAFIGSFFTPIVSGAQVVLLSEEDARDPLAIKNNIVKHQVTHFVCVPSLYMMLLENLTAEDANSLRIVTLGGEKISPKLVAKSKEINPRIEIVNEYGPTEASVIATVNRNLQPNSLITIGKPIANTEVFILNKNNQLMPIGVAGELCIAGKGLARGYLQRPELTAEKFVLNSLSAYGRMYKTGDLARWLPDGSIEFLGRIDHQVKIRGYRIETGEIEAQLMRYEGIKEAVVLDQIDATGAEYLCAYIVSDDENQGTEIDSSEIRDFLAKELPEYMIPAHYILLSQIPLTANGKIDRKALTGLKGRIEAINKYVAPETADEKRMASIWSAILALEKIGVDDSFFELGGHSLKATQLAAKILKEFQIELPLRDIFKAPTIRKMLKRLKDIEGVNYSAIPVVDERAYYPVSSAQKRLFALKELEGEGVTYNTPTFITVKGDLDTIRLEKAFLAMIARHESLRTSFAVQNDQVVQRVHEDVEFSIWKAEATGLNSTEKIAEIVNSFVQPFDLTKAPLLRVGLVKTAEDMHLLMMDMHHIISDGTSISIFFSELFRLYDGKSLPTLRIQYKDFSVWQNKLFQSAEIQKQEKYWLNAFAGEIPVLNLLTDYSPMLDGDPTGFIHRPEKKSVEGSVINFALSEELSQKVNELATQEEATLYMVLLAAFNLLLARYSGQEDIIVGSPIAGRNHPDLEQIIGMFVNTLAMRNYPVSSISFKEFLHDVKERALKAYENQDYPFEMLVEKLDLHQDLSRNALFDVMFVLQNLDGVSLQQQGLHFIPYQYNYHIAKFDLTLNAFEENHKIGFNFEYSVQLFKQETIERMIEHFINIIQSIVNNPNQSLGAIEMLTPEERTKMLAEFNDTRVEYPNDQTIYQLFAIQVQRIPEKIAVTCGDQKLTYGELDFRANQVAYKLKSLGVKPNQIVGIMVERSLEMVIGILAILKSGGAYLPIDPQYADNRIEFMLKDSNVKVLLNHGQSRTQKFLADIEEVNLTDKAEVKNAPALLNQNQSSDLAYVIYTSGSTGQPKGVMIEHRNILNTIRWRIDEYKTTEVDRVLQLLSFAFDGSVAGFFASLIAGSELILMGEKEIKDPMQIRDIISRREITHLVCVPSLYGAILEFLRPEDVKRLKVVTLGGEAVKAYLITKTRELSSQIELVNEYGPTENSVTTTILRNLQEAERVTIGKPIANTQVYILDKNMRIVPIGVAGELCLAGEGLARGYLNRPELTVEKFVQHQFINPNVPELRIYKTGDLGRWLPDGKIEYLGRIDQQVKIRGFRIELGEIENQLLRNERIREAAVIDKVNSRGEVSLCAYLVCDADLTDMEIREKLAQILPDYMIPRYFIRLDAILVTTNGKLDRKALPEVDESMNSENEYIAPTSDSEQIFADIWSQILGRNHIGIHDNFFELGGDSIKAIQIVARAIQQGINIKTEDLFKYKTIASIINNVDYRTSTRQISQKEVKGEVLLTPIQKWFFSENFCHRHYFNQNILCMLPDDVNLELLENAFKKLIEHHDALRMSYDLANKQVYQHNRRADQVEFVLQYVDLSSEPYEAQKEKLQMISERIQDQLNLQEDLLIRGVIFELGEHGKRLLISVHHLVIDGVSWRILLEDLEILYNSKLEKKLSLKTTSCQEWSQKLQDYARREIIDTAYWEKIDLSKIKPLVEEKVSDNCFRDYQRLPFELNEEQTEQLLTKVHWAFNTEINDILLSALTLALTESRKVENVLLTLEGHGREEIIDDVDLSRTIGWFTSIYPVYFERQEEIGEMIKHIKENLRRVPNKGLNFGIARYLKHNQMLARINPEISFNYLGQFSNNQEETEMKNKFLKDCPENPGLSIHPDNQQPVLLDVTGSIVHGKLQFTMSYHPAYLNEQWMDELTAKFQRCLSEIIEYCCTQTEQTNTVSDYGVEDILDEDDLDYMKDLLDL